MENNSAPLIIDGKAIAASVVEKVQNETQKLLKEHDLKPGIAVVIVGDDPASQVYVRNKGLKAEACGFKSVTHRLDEETSQKDLLNLVDQLNNDTTIHGILVQLPLPRHIDKDEVIQAIAPEKDVDGFHFINVGKLGAGVMQTALLPCTPAGCMILLREARGDDLSGLHAVVIGRSNIVGKPMAQLLLQANATVTIAHRHTPNVPQLCRSADIVVAAVGIPEMVKADWLKPGASVIDVGINRVDAPEKGEGKTRLVGDVAYEEAVKVAGAITPVPGGVGPMTIALLMANTLKAAYVSKGIEAPRF